jgi:hypothetical protein
MRCGGDALVGAQAEADVLDRLKVLVEQLELIAVDADRHITVKRRDRAPQESPLDRAGPAIIRAALDHRSGQVVRTPTRDEHQRGEA